MLIDVLCNHKSFALIPNYKNVKNVTKNTCSPQIGLIVLGKVELQKHF